MPAKDNFQGVSNCYVFKSRLQEYAQKVGLPTPVYETIKEGPSHEPTFHSTVIVNDVRYDSLPGFSNRKAAEQSAAEVALMELSKSSDLNPHASLPVHETGLCKNLLQEYAQKMNFAIPLYQCQKDEGQGRTPHFSCTVEIGGIRYIGAVAKTKKEAEIKAARTALLAIQSCPTSLSEKSIDRTQLTVIPCNKRKEADCSFRPNTARAPGTKKGRFKRVSRNRGLRNGQPIFTSRELNIDGSNYEPFATGVVQVPGLVNSVELAKDTIQNSECRTTDQSSNDDSLLVSNIQSNMPPPVNGIDESVELARDTLQNSEYITTNSSSNDDGPLVSNIQIDMPPPVNGIGESVELAKDAIQNSEYRMTIQSSNDDGILVSNIHIDMPQPLKGFGESDELAKDTIQNSEYRTTDISSNDDSLVVSNIQIDMPTPVNSFGESAELAKDTIQNSEYRTTNQSSNDDSLLVSNIQIDMPPPVNSFGESVELAKDTIQNSEYRKANLSSNDDSLLVSNIQIDMPPPVNGDSGALSSNQMNSATSDVSTFPLSDVQPTSAEVGNIATRVTGELQ